LTVRVREETNSWKGKSGKSEYLLESHAPKMGREGEGRQGEDIGKNTI